MDKIIIALPVPKNPLTDVRTMEYIFSEGANQVSFSWSRSPFAELGRNNIIATHLQDPEVTHIYLLDADSVPPRGALKKLWDMQVPIAAGMTPIIINGTEHVWNVQKPEGLYYGRQEMIPKINFATPCVGGNALLVRREVFEQIGYPWFKAVLNQNPADCIGEDEWFCQRALSCGHEIIINPEVVCDHYNNINLLTLNELSGSQSQPKSTKLTMDAYATHMPVLAACVNVYQAMCLELGAGMYSTPMLSKNCDYIVTCENNENWLKMLASTLENDRHHFRHVTDWDDCDVFERQWDLVFVDHDPGERRAKDIGRLNAKCIVVHDSDQYNLDGILREFKFRYDYKKLTPHTSVVSNTNNLAFLKDN